MSSSHFSHGGANSTSRERIRAVADAGADAFTIGTAVFDGSYNPRRGSILSQLGNVVADCEMV